MHKILIEIVIEIGIVRLYKKSCLKINIHQSTSLSQKIALGSADFLHSGTGYSEIAVLVPCRLQSRFQ